MCSPADDPLAVKLSLFYQDINKYWMLHTSTQVENMAFNCNVIIFAKLCVVVQKKTKLLSKTIMREQQLFLSSYSQDWKAFVSWKLAHNVCSFPFSLNGFISERHCSDIINLLFALCQSSTIIPSHAIPWSGSLLAKIAVSTFHLRV